MAKKNRYESCIFCGDIPCSCDAPASKTKPVKKSSSKSIEAESKKSFDLDGLSPAPEQKRFQVDKQEVERDLSYEAALAALLPILDPFERKKVEVRLNHSVPAKTGKAIHDWRTRNVR